ncbi:MAG: hypothetical protein WCD18_22390 [Thermosynechococcaceae cyanobacterium]
MTAHVEYDRIHKLLYWTCKGRWETDPLRFNSVSTNQLLNHLVKHSPTLKDLEHRLYAAAEALNKAAKYKLVAALIIRTCSSCYLPASAVLSAIAPEDDMLTGLILQDDSLDYSAPIAVVNPPDRFELRRLLMQQIPPLKIKILLFSILRHPFSFKAADWVELRAQSLDAWLSELFQCFPAIETLEKRLYDQASQMQTLDQGIQVAEAILQAVRS